MFIFNRSKKYKSSINGKINIGKREGKKTLFSGGVTQSGGELVDMWNHTINIIKKEIPTAKNCLVLGVAGGTFISSISKEFPKIKITGIELDHVMIDLYNSQFREKEINLNLINENAINWINENKKRFDIILVDLYIGRLNPTEIREELFLQKLSKNLTKRGVIIYNSHYNKNNIEEFEIFKKLVDNLFMSEIIYEFPLNKIFLLSQRENISKNLKNEL